MIWTILHFIALFQAVYGQTPKTCKRHCEYEYSVQRNALLKMEEKFAGYQQNYTDDEQIVYSYLEYLKWEEFKRTKHDFPPARPVKLHIDEVKQTRIYKLLKKFPKGGNLHLHHNHVVSKETIFNIIENSSLYENLYVKQYPPGQYRLDFFINPPDGWTKVKDSDTFTKEKIIKHATLLGVMDDIATSRPTDSEQRWKETSPLFSVIGSQVISHANICAIYMDAVLQAAVDENVQYLEARSSAYNKLYVLDTTDKYISSHGKRFIDTDIGELELLTVQNAVNTFMEKNPDFIGYKRIVSAYRGDITNVEKSVQNAVALYKKYPHFVAGFDLVAEEDKGYSLLFFLEEFLHINSVLPFLFHTGETNWPDELMSSMRENDPVPTMGNLRESILLGAKRVGHGLGYIKHPLLMEMLKTNNIAIEVNPISNKLLGYVPDQRNHPAITYLRYGIPVILGADDPGTFGYNEFTYDWYEVFMSWGLTLADIRHLAFNSIHYSSMSKSEKITAQNKWRKLYDKFIVETKSLACTETFTNVLPSVHLVLPQEGSAEGGTIIQVFGRNLHVALCQQIYCKFDEMISKGTFKYEHQIICMSPAISTSGYSMTKTLSISLDGGTTYLTKTFNFTYFKKNIINSSNKNASLLHLIYLCVFFLIIYLIRIPF